MWSVAKMTLLTFVEDGKCFRFRSNLFTLELHPVKAQLPQVWILEDVKPQLHEDSVCTSFTYSYLTFSQ